MERLHDGRDGDAEGPDLGAVDVEERLRRIGAAVGVDEGEMPVPHRCHQPLGDLLEGPGPEVRSVLNVELEASCGAEPLDGRGGEHPHLGIAHLRPAALSHLGDDPHRRRLAGAAPVVVVEDEEHRAPVGGGGVVEERCARDRERLGDAGDVAGDSIEPGEHLACALHGGAVGQLGGDDEVALVLEGNESDGIDGR